MKLHACLMVLCLTLVFFTPASASEQYLYIDIDKPLEGEVFTGGSQTNISWNLTTSFDLSSVEISLEYVHDGMGPYVITENIPGTVDNYSWEVPEIDPDIVHLIIRAEGADLKAWDMVSINIESTPPELIEYTPWDGGTLLSNEDIVFVFNKEIRREDFSSNFTLSHGDDPVFGWFDYHTDEENGTFAASFSPAGRLDHDKQYRLTLNGSIRDHSEPGNILTIDMVVNFTVEEGAPSVNVYEPSIGTEVLVDDRLNITWSTGGYTLDESPIDISYSIDGGDSWRSIRTGIDDIGKIQWTVPSISNVDYPLECMINVSALSIDGHTGYAHSSSFEIIDNIPPKVEISRPYQGSYVVRGYNYRIRWEAHDNRPLPTNPITISISEDGGINWRIISHSIRNTGEHIWRANVSPGDVLINVTVTDSHGASSWDHSAPLTVLPSNPLSMSVNPNSTFYHSRSHVNITWSSPDLSREMQYVRFNISYNGGSTWTTLKEVDAEQSYANISIPFQMSDDCIIRLEVGDEDGTMFHYDSHRFEIMPELLESTVEHSGDFTFVNLRFEGWVGLSNIQRAFTLYRDGEIVEVDNRDLMQVGSPIIIYIGRDLGPGEYTIRLESEDDPNHDFSDIDLLNFQIEEDEEQHNYHYLFGLLPVSIVIAQLVYMIKGKKRSAFRQNYP